jgi:hypothetical protein
MRTGRIETDGSDAAGEGIDKAVMREAVLLQMTWLGAPTVYYGDEAGLCGFTDPDNRRTYPWGKENFELVEFHREMIRIHRRNPVLKYGSTKILKAEDEMLAFARFDDKVQMLTVINMSEEEQKSFYTKQMRVRFNLNGKILEPKELIFNKTGIFAKYESNDDTNENSIVLDVKIAFTIPQRKTFSYFFVSLSDPTYSPHIVFSYPEDEINVEMISFMNRNITTTNAKVFDGLREITMEDEWILPMSGVVFIITPQE